MARGELLDIFPPGEDIIAGLVDWGVAKLARRRTLDP